MFLFQLSGITKEDLTKQMEAWRASQVSLTNELTKNLQNKNYDAAKSTLQELQSNLNKAYSPENQPQDIADISLTLAKMQKNITGNAVQKLTLNGQSKNLITAYQELGQSVFAKAQLKPEGTAKKLAGTTITVNQAPAALMQELNGLADKLKYNVQQAKEEEGGKYFGYSVFAIGQIISKIDFAYPDPEARPAEILNVANMISGQIAELNKALLGLYSQFKYNVAQAEKLDPNSKDAKKYFEWALSDIANINAKIEAATPNAALRHPKIVELAKTASELPGTMDPIGSHGKFLKSPGLQIETNLLMSQLAGLFKDFDASMFISYAQQRANIAALSPTQMPKIIITKDEQASQVLTHKSEFKAFFDQQAIDGLKNSSAYLKKLPQKDFNSSLYDNFERALYDAEVGPGKDRREFTPTPQARKIIHEEFTQSGMSVDQQRDYMRSLVRSYLDEGVKARRKQIMDNNSTGIVEQVMGKGQQPTVIQKSQEQLQQNKIKEETQKQQQQKETPKEVKLTQGNDKLTINTENVKKENIVPGKFNANDVNLPSEAVLNYIEKYDFDKAKLLFDISKNYLSSVQTSRDELVKVVSGLREGKLEEDRQQAFNLLSQAEPSLLRDQITALIVDMNDAKKTTPAQKAKYLDALMQLVPIYRREFAPDTKFSHDELKAFIDALVRVEIKGNKIFGMIPLNDIEQISKFALYGREDGDVAMISLKAFNGATDAQKQQRATEFIDYLKSKLGVVVSDATLSQGSVVITFRKATQPEYKPAQQTTDKTVKEGTVTGTSNVGTITTPVQKQVQPTQTIPFQTVVADSQFTGKQKIVPQDDLASLKSEMKIDSLAASIQSMAQKFGPIDAYEERSFLAFLKSPDFENYLNSNSGTIMGALKGQSKSVKETVTYNVIAIARDPTLATDFGIKSNDAKIKDLRTLDLNPISTP